MRHLPDHLALIEMMGLTQVLRFACPTDDATIHSKSLWVTRPTFLSFGTRIWTPEWLAFIQSQQSPPPSPARNSSRPQMVVHIRRGDVDLCNPELTFRYLPNSHYLRLIQEFSEEDTEVTVYSESTSTESWDDFRSSVDHLYLDAPLIEVWRAMITADVFIMSMSGFSNVPAVFNRHGRVVYTPFWELPLAHWHVVGDDTMKLMHDEKEQLKAEIC